MDQESSDRIPVSSIILFASIVFTLTAYATFRALWKIDIPIWHLLIVLGLQFASWLLGSRKILTQLGAASFSAVIAVVACMAAVFLMLPPVLEIRIAGGIGGGVALVFILASFVAASRMDPVPASPHEPLDLGDIKDDPTAELIKYGEPQADDAHADQDQTVALTPTVVEVPDEQAVEKDSVIPSIEEDKVYEFDELSESKLGLALGGADKDSLPETLNLEDEDVTKLLDVPSPEAVEENEWERAPEPPDEPAIPDDWVEETARSMAYDASMDEGEKDDEGLSQAVEGLPTIRMRTRYKVLDFQSGEHYGTYYGDEGYSTVDPPALAELIGSKPADGELRIVKLDWSNFDEVEVHIKIEEVVPIDLEKGEEVGTGVKEASPAAEKEPEHETEPAADDAPSEISPVLETEESNVPTVEASAAPRYMIYNRRTIQPMAEYIPEGNRSRIDRLTLYRMFPEYDFKTFEIDSVRWEGDEVRIFIKGEKKKVGSGA